MAYVTAWTRLTALGGSLASLAACNEPLASEDSAAASPSPPDCVRVLPLAEDTAVAEGGYYRIENGFLVEVDGPSAVFRESGNEMPSENDDADVDSRGTEFTGRER